MKMIKGLGCGALALLIGGMVLGCDPVTAEQPDAGMDARVWAGAYQDPEQWLDGGGDPPSVGTVLVVLTDVEDRPVADASVVVNDEDVGNTDAQGQLCVTDLLADQFAVVLTHSHLCTTAARTVFVYGGMTTLVELTCLPLTTKTLQDGALGGTLTGDDGFALEIPPNSLSRGNVPVTGAVQVHIGVLNQQEQMAAAPGDMLADVDGPNLVSLESFGMVEVKFSQDGEEVVFDGEATLWLPLRPAPGLAHGETVALWHFDEGEGVWRQRGSGTVDTQLTGSPVFVATVTHFSWWNCDAPITDKNCVEGRLVDGNGDPAQGVDVRAVGIDYMGMTAGRSDDQGRFCVTVKRSSTIELISRGVLNGTIQAWDATGISVDGPGSDCDLGDCVDVGDLVGTTVVTLLTCE